MLYFARILKKPLKGLSVSFKQIQAKLQYPISDAQNKLVPDDELELLDFKINILNGYTSYEPCEINSNNATHTIKFRNLKKQDDFVQV